MFTDKIVEDCDDIDIIELIVKQRQYTQPNSLVKLFDDAAGQRTMNFDAIKKKDLKKLKNWAVNTRASFDTPLTYATKIIVKAHIGMSTRKRYEAEPDIIELMEDCVANIIVQKTPPGGLTANSIQAVVNTLQNEANVALRNPAKLSTLFTVTSIEGDTLSGHGVLSVEIE